MTTSSPRYARIATTVLALLGMIGSAGAQRPAAELAAAMDEATGLARDGLSRFLGALASGQGEAFAVKVSVRERGPYSHVWLVDLEHHGDRLSGAERLAAASGVRRQVSLDEVIDWTYRHDGFTHGAFTSCVANPSQPPLPFD